MWPHLPTSPPPLHNRYLLSPTSLVCVGTEIDVLPAFLGQGTEKVRGHDTAYEEAGSQWSVVPAASAAGPRPDLFWTTKGQEEARTSHALQAIPGLTPSSSWKRVAWC